MNYGRYSFEIPKVESKTLDELSIISTEQTKLQNGDIIFQISKSSQSKAIQMATNSKYSHMGIIYEINDEFFVYEAIQPVQITHLNDWIERGENSHYVVKRLINSEEVLTENAIEKMKEYGKQFAGKPYDIHFEWSNRKLYCSELVWKIYKNALGIEIGQLQKLSEFDLSNKVVKDKMKERYGNNIPLNEKVISPAAMFESELLVVVEDNL
ncbi:YiiX family permuted papain-like enzyme [Brumimicrobium mesophilum]|uniref:YiiX family permuted papain-like enzyme n=1 Tax=Brumimicrobium mesophilum TaxID=392717 RepID=UPI000D144AD5|nr:YiiX family permuted papain-like enzyme [Brumimicrobium mesophilum]